MRRTALGRGAAKLQHHSRRQHQWPTIPEAPARALERAGKLKKQQQQEDVAVDVAALEERTTATTRSALGARAVQFGGADASRTEAPRGATRSRASIIEELAADLSVTTSSSRTVDLFLTIFSPHECVEFLDASVKPRPVVARCNTLKARRKDVAAGGEGVAPSRPRGLVQGRAENQRRRARRRDARVPGGLVHAPVGGSTPCCPRPETGSTFGYARRRAASRATAPSS